MDKEKIMEQAKELIGERNDDVALDFLSNLYDALNGNDIDISNKIEEEKAKIENEWREKYKQRFFTPTEIPQESKIEEKELTYDNLFKKGG